MSQFHECVCSWWLKTCWLCCDTHCSRSYELMESFQQDSSTLDHTQLSGTDQHPSTHHSSRKTPSQCHCQSSPWHSVTLYWPEIPLLLGHRAPISERIHIWWLSHPLSLHIATNLPVWEPGQALLLEAEGIQSFGLLIRLLGLVYLLSTGVRVGTLLSVVDSA